jgi:hypothetical protein
LLPMIKRLICFRNLTVGNILITGAPRPLGLSEEVARPREFFFVQTAFNIAMLPRLREENTLEKTR